MKSLALTPSLVAAATLLVGLPMAGTSAHAETPTVAQIVARTNHASYYQGKDGRADLTMTITDRNGRKRVRKFTMLRRNDSADQDSGQRFYVYFHTPADVAKTVFMVRKRVRGADDRWLYIAGLDLVKRIAASDKRTSFVGSNFVYEDISGRGLSEDRHQLVKTTKSYYVLKNTPKNPANLRFGHYIMYIHRGTYLPTRVEYYSRSGKKYRVMTVDSVKTIQGHPTVTQSTVRDLAKGGRTTLRFSKVRYNNRLPKRIFTERYLRRAPVKYLR